MIGLVVGALIGWLRPDWGNKVYFLRDIFINLIKAIIAPLIFSTIVVGIAGALWSASGYVGAFMRASNAIYDMDEGRPIWMTIPVRLAVTVGRAPLPYAALNCRMTQVL